MRLRDWQARHGFTYDTAAAALGVSRRTYARLLKREALPRLVGLAMKRLDEERAREFDDCAERFWSSMPKIFRGPENASAEDAATFAEYHKKIMDAAFESALDQLPDTEAGRFVKAAMKRIDDEKGMK